MGLGRGFDTLIPTDLFDEDFDPTAKEDKKESKLKELDLESVRRDEEQPRHEFDAEALEELASSVKTYGVLQPIVVTKEEGYYKIVAGERRWRAAKLAGLKKIPAIVRTIDAQNRLELSIIENAQREDLNAIELATAFVKLKTQFNLSAEEIAARIGKGKAAVEQTIRLLNLPDFAKKAMIEHKLSEGVMRPLIAADEKVVLEALPRIVEEGWTARRVEQFVKVRREEKGRSSAQIVKERKFQKREEALGAKWNAKAKITGKSITLTCRNAKELEKILAALEKE